MSHYYNENAQAFFEGTVAADMSANYTEFLARLPKGSYLLDAGCGSGRDAKAFMEKGYKVDAIDASKEMCRLASNYTGLEVKELRFQDIDIKEVYDGIWASATLLHVPSKEMGLVLKKMNIALKPQGILYASFKYGEFEGERNGRYFHDLKEEKAKAFFTQAGFKVVNQWITGDVREGRGDEKWLNILCEKPE